MRRVGGYAATGLGILGFFVAVLWPWLDASGRRGVLAAAAVAWPVQVAAFGLLVRHRGETRRFLAVWVGGTLVRMAVILAAAFALTRVSGLAPVPTLLGLAGFFFGLLLLEPVFFRRGDRSRGAENGDGEMAMEPAGTARREST